MLSGVDGIKSNRLENPVTYPAPYSLPINNFIRIPNYQIAEKIDRCAFFA